MAVKRLTAVMAAADAYARGVHQSSNVVGMNLLHNEGREGATARLLIWRRAQYPNTINRLKTIEQMPRELGLPSLNL